MGACHNVPTSCKYATDVGLTPACGHHAELIVRAKMPIVGLISPLSTCNQCWFAIEYRVDFCMFSTQANTDEVSGRRSVKVEECQLMNICDEFCNAKTCIRKFADTKKCETVFRGCEKNT